MYVAIVYCGIGLAVYVSPIVLSERQKDEARLSISGLQFEETQQEEKKNQKTTTTTTYTQKTAYLV